MDVNHGMEAMQNRTRSELGEPFIEKRSINDVDCFKEKRSGKESIAYVFISTLVVVVGSYEFGSCVSYSAPIQSAISKDLDLSVAEFSLFGSLLNVGAIIGAITSGYMTDQYGRKWAMRIPILLSSADRAAIYFSKGALLLCTGRFFTGCGIGILSFVVPIYIAEITPKELRGGLATLNQLMLVLGIATTLILGTLVTWQTLALRGIMPCLVLLLGLSFIPESPRWLEKAGHQKEFIDTLRKFRGDNADISHEAAEIQENLQTLMCMPKVGMLDLFYRRYLHAVTIGVGLMFFQQFGGVHGIGFYAALCAVLMDNCGRKPLLLVSATGTFVGCFLAGTAFLLKNHGILEGWVPILVLAGVLTYIGSFSIGMGAIPWIIMSEILPINIKGAAGNLANMVNWLSAWAVSYSFNFLMEWSPAGTFYVFSGFCAVAVLFVVKRVPETKGKTLEEIQASLNAHNNIPAHYLILVYSDPIFKNLVAHVTCPLLGFSFIRLVCVCVWMKVMEEKSKGSLFQSDRKMNKGKKIKMKGVGIDVDSGDVIITVVA